MQIYSTDNSITIFCDQTPAQTIIKPLALGKTGDLMLYVIAAVFTGKRQQSANAH